MQPGYRSTGYIALTFDDGPDPVWTPLVLDALAEARALATFFVIAPQARRYPALLTRMRAEGHDVGFHFTQHVRHGARGDRIRPDIGSAGTVRVRTLLADPVGLRDASD
jgi:peptidoglycan/xylan/chitin deacetylase (PgdA/CDA1 family)